MWCRVVWRGWCCSSISSSTTTTTPLCKHHELRPFTMRVHEYHIIAMVGSDWWLPLHYSPTAAFNVEMDITPPPVTFFYFFYFLLLKLALAKCISPPKSIREMLIGYKGVKVLWHLPMGVEGETNTPATKEAFLTHDRPKQILPKNVLKKLKWNSLIRKLVEGEWENVDILWCIWVYGWRVLRLAFVSTKFRLFMCPNSQDCNGNAHGGRIR